MKIWKIAGISAIVVLALAALTAGFAFAQAPTPPMPGFGWGGMAPAPASGAGVAGGGMMFSQGNGYGWMTNMHQWMYTTGADSMHNLVWDGLADALGLTPDQLNGELAAGKTLAQVAEAQGVSQEQLAEALETSVTAGLETAVADGVLTQEQADWMLDRTPALASGASVGGNFGWMITHMNSVGGFGPGDCHGTLAPPTNS